MSILRFGRWFHAAIALPWCLLLIDTIVGNEGPAAVVRAAACAAMFLLFLLGTLLTLRRHRQEETMRLRH
ncbi:hypothetical protein ACFW5I_36385 [Streptomyces sp. NPDC058818]|uniref:hypothetical protein n=1 Tax=Streptomyces sp. NPDC058818 TaxID=3346640 RepID=UPI003698DBAF